MNYDEGRGDHSSEIPQIANLLPEVAVGDGGDIRQFAKDFMNYDEVRE